MIVTVKFVSHDHNYVRCHQLLQQLSPQLFYYLKPFPDETNTNYRIPGPHFDNP